MIVFYQSWLVFQRHPHIKDQMSTWFTIVNWGSFSSGNMSKANLRFSVYLIKASSHKEFPFALTRPYACCTVDVSWIPYLCDTHFVIAINAEIIRVLSAKLCACASASSARNSQYAQLTHSATIENRVSDLRRHAHFNIEWHVTILGHLHPAVDRE